MNSYLQVHQVDFLLQANHTGRSQAMELEGAKLCFEYLQNIAGLAIKVFVSCQHRGIAKWIRVPTFCGSLL